ncbi:hypothetical protein L1987_57352 [Smallanthus sonchifolius]|uniref:Uncharacterized protein n=1 Tax=Smallanthus sonchifolius TaxID=185202 RepID=A0ACB9DCS5_9ASTR|nr:hypothetical protein L1987_57352 [Smallanthus sonchifolius]
MCLSLYDLIKNFFICFYDKLLESVVKNCGDIVHMQVAERDLLHDIVKKKRFGANFPEKSARLVLVITPPQTQSITSVPHNPENENETHVQSAEADSPTLSWPVVYIELTGRHRTGSVPTPIEVVEALPVKHYRKLSKHLNEDDAQYVYLKYITK